MKKKGKKSLALHWKFILSYKKNTAAVFFCFFLTFMLLTLLLVLIHTNHRIANLQAKAEFTPSDCYIDSLSWEEVQSLKKDGEVEKAAAEQEKNNLFQKNNQRFYMTRCDETAMTMMNCLKEGRLPQKPGQVAAEEWVLLNLGIQPEIGQTFSIQDEETEEEYSVTLTGILSDIYSNKKYGLLSFIHLWKKEGKKTTILYILNFVKGQIIGLKQKN